MLILLLPSASASSLPREQCWPQGSAPTNAAQNAAAISVLRSWGSAFDALAGSDVCHMATRSAARKGAPSGWPLTSRDAPPVSTVIVVLSVPSEDVYAALVHGSTSPV